MAATKKAERPTTYASGYRMSSTSDQRRKEVWEALNRHNGDREQAARDLRVSVRTLYRYIDQLNLWSEIDKHRWFVNPGPPRGEKGRSRLREAIVDHINKNDGSIDIAELTVALYDEVTPATRQRIYSALNELKAGGVIARAGTKWFVL